MSLFTLIGRVTDGMPLAGTQEHRSEYYDLTQQAKGILKRLNAHSPARCIIESGSCLFYYVIEDYVCYLVLAERSYPGDLAYRYLEEVQRQFVIEHGPQVPTYSRPYAAVSFDSRLNRIRRDYLDPRSASNLQAVNRNLAEVHNIMRQNIQEVLTRGEKIDAIENRAADLVQGSKEFKRSSKWLQLQAMYKAYLPYVAVLIIIVFILYMKLG